MTTSKAIIIGAGILGTAIPGFRYRQPSASRYSRAKSYRSSKALTEISLSSLGPPTLTIRTWGIPLRERSSTTSHATPLCLTQILQAQRQVIPSDMVDPAPGGNSDAGIGIQRPRYTGEFDIGVTTMCAEADPGPLRDEPETGRECRLRPGSRPSPAGNDYGQLTSQKLRPTVGPKGSWAAGQPSISNSLPSLTSLTAWTARP